MGSGAADAAAAPRRGDQRKASKVEPFSPSDDWDVPRPLTCAEQQRVASIITPPVEHRPDSWQVQIEVERMRVRQAALEQFNAEQFRPDEIPAAISLAEMIHNPYRETPARIAGWLPKGGNGVLSSQAKAGKSTARNNLVRSVVDGDPWLGQYPVEPIHPGHTVYVLSLENGRGLDERWLKLQGIRNVDAVKLVDLRGCAGAFNIMDEQTFWYWVAVLDEDRCAMLIVDPARPCLDAAGLDENRDVGRWLARLDELRAHTSVSEIIVCHHMGHQADTGGRSKERPRGDSRWRDWPDAEWKLVKADADDLASPCYIKAYGRDVDQSEQLIVFDPENHHYTIGGGSRHDTATDEALDAIIEVLTASDVGLSGRAIERALDDSDHTQKTIRDALRRGIEAGVIDRTTGPQNSHLHTVSASVRSSALPVRQRSSGECVSAFVENAHAHTPDADPDSESLNALEPVTESEALVNITEMLGGEIIEGGTHQ